MGRTDQVTKWFRPSWRRRLQRRKISGNRVWHGLIPAGRSLTGMFHVLHRHAGVQQPQRHAGHRGRSNGCSRPQRAHNATAALQRCTVVGRIAKANPTDPKNTWRVGRSQLAKFSSVILQTVAGLFRKLEQCAKFPRWRQRFCDTPVTCSVRRRALHPGGVSGVATARKRTGSTSDRCVSGFGTHVPCLAVLATAPASQRGNCAVYGTFVRRNSMATKHDLAPLANSVDWQSNKAEDVAKSAGRDAALMTIPRKVARRPDTRINIFGAKELHCPPESDTRFAQSKGMQYV